MFEVTLYSYMNANQFFLWSQSQNIKHLFTFVEGLGIRNWRLGIGDWGLGMSN